MSIVNGLILRIKRAETPPTRFLKRLLRSYFNPTLPPIPRIFLSPLRLLYEGHFLTISVFRWILTCATGIRCSRRGARVSDGGFPWTGFRS